MVEETYCNAQMETTVRRKSESDINMNDTDGLFSFESNASIDHPSQKKLDVWCTDSLNFPYSLASQTDWESERMRRIIRWYGDAIVTVCAVTDSHVNKLRLLDYISIEESTKEENTTTNISSSDGGIFFCISKQPNDWLNKFGLNQSLSIFWTGYLLDIGNTNE